MVPPGQLTRFDFSRGDLDPGDADMQAYALADGPSEKVEVEVRYTDMDGEQSTRTRVVAYSFSGGGGSVSEILLYHGDDTEPFAELTKRVEPD